MINFSSSAVFYIHKEPINMLNGFEGLSTAIKAKFNNEIKKDSFYLFLNKKKRPNKNYILGYRWLSYLVQTP